VSNKHLEFGLKNLLKTLPQFGSTESKWDPSLFSYSQQNGTVYFLFYVDLTFYADDIIIIGKTTYLVQHLIHKLHFVFSVKQLGCL